jgi:hypothetical protein
MKLRPKITIVIACILIIAAISFAYCVDYYFVNYVIGRQTVRYDQPMSYLQATNAGFDFPLPASSHNVRFYYHTEWLEYEFVVRFEAPTEDCIKQIPIVLAWDDKTYNRTSSYPVINVTNVERQTDINDIKWFDADKITNGVYTGENGSHTPQIWIDRDRGVFYFWETD